MIYSVPELAFQKNICRLAIRREDSTDIFEKLIDQTLLVVQANPAREVD